MLVEEDFIFDDDGRVLKAQCKQDMFHIADKLKWDFFQLDDKESVGCLKK